MHTLKQCRWKVSPRCEDVDEFSTGRSEWRLSRTTGNRKCRASLPCGCVCGPAEISLGERPDYRYRNGWNCEMLFLQWLNDWWLRLWVVPFWAENHFWSWGHFYLLDSFLNYLKMNHLHPFLSVLAFRTCSQCNTLPFYCCQFEK